MKFYSSVRLDVRRIGAIKEASAERKGEMSVVGNRTRVKVVKNKMAPPFREVEFDIIYGKGISRSGEVVDRGVDAGIIQKSGSWYSIGSERIGQGRDNARRYLEEHPETMQRVEREVLSRHGIGPKVAAEGKDEAAASEPAKKSKPNGQSRRSPARSN